MRGVESTSVVEVRYIENSNVFSFESVRVADMLVNRSRRNPGTSPASRVVCSTD